MCVGLLSSETVTVGLHYCSKNKVECTRKLDELALTCGSEKPVNQRGRIQKSLRNVYLIGDQTDLQGSATLYISSLMFSDAVPTIADCPNLTQLLIVIVFMSPIL